MRMENITEIPTEESPALPPSGVKLRKKMLAELIGMRYFNQNIDQIRKEYANKWAEDHWQDIGDQPTNQPTVTTFTSKK